MTRSSSLALGLVLSLVTSLVTVAQAAPRAATQAPELSVARRKQLAIKAVTHALDDKVRPGQHLEITTAIVDPAGGHHNPITQGGPIVVIARQVLPPSASRWQRLRAHFSKYSDRTFDVSVDSKGNAQILDQVYQAPQYRLGRFLSTKLQLPMLLSDLLGSSKFKQGLVSAVSGGTSLAFNPLVAGSLLSFAVTSWGQGIGEQHRLRKEALTSTASWAKQEIKNDKQPTLKQAYLYYQDALQNSTSPSIRPLSISEFSNKLMLKDL